MTDDGQLALDFGLSVFDEPALTKEEFRRYRYTPLEPPPTWGGRPYVNVEPTGERL
jgi:hypothetical protein